LGYQISSLTRSRMTDVTKKVFYLIIEKLFVPLRFIIEEILQPNKKKNFANINLNTDIGI